MPFDVIDQRRIDTTGLGVGWTPEDFATAAQGAKADTALQPAAIGSLVQAYDADLTALGGLPKTDGNFIVGNGTTWVAETGSAARTSLGLGSAATTDVGTGPGTVAAGDDARIETSKQAATFASVSAASSATVPAENKRLRTQFFSPSYADPKTLVGGADYRRISLADITDYPTASYFRSADRFMPDGTTDATNGGYWVLDDLIPNVYQFGAVGDNSTDDVNAFQQWGEFCGITRRGGFIPFGAYALGSLITWTDPFDIESDESAILRWTVSNGGIVGDFRSNPFGLNKWVLPAGLSSAINSSFQIPGYSVADGYTYVPSTRNGTFLNIIGASRYTIEVQNAQGWENAFHIEASNDVTYGPRNVANVELFVNTADFCENLFYLDGGPSGSDGVVAFKCYANTAWVKRVVKANGENSIVGGGGTINVGGQVFLNEPDACSVYAEGTNVSDFKVDLQWALAGKSADSPSTAPSDLVCMYIGGNGASNGLASDGGDSSVGYFMGTNVEMTIGAVMGAPLPSYPKIGGYPSASLGKIRVKNAGNNRITIRGQDVGQPAAVPLSATQGEANFNGGIGGALLARRQLVEAVVPTLADGGGVGLYFYHQLFSVGRRIPVTVTPIDTSLLDSGLNFIAADRALADGVNRQGLVYVTNQTGASVPGATYYFWLDIG